MTEETHKTWDTLTKITGPVLTIVGIWVGISQFNAGQIEARKVEERGRVQEAKIRAENDTLEFKRKIWDKQQKVYTETAEVVGEIAALIDLNQTSSVKNLFNHFYKLYWGSMILVEDAEVEEKMHALYREVHDYQHENLNKDFFIKRIKIRAAILNKTLKASYTRSWRELNRTYASVKSAAGREDSK